MRGTHWAVGADFKESPLGLEPGRGRPRPRGGPTSKVSESGSPLCAQTQAPRLPQQTYAPTLQMPQRCRTEATDGMSTLPRRFATLRRAHVPGKRGRLSYEYRTTPHVPGERGRLTHDFFLNPALGRPARGCGLGWPLRPPGSTTTGRAWYLCTATKARLGPTASGPAGPHVPRRPASWSPPQ